jgi:hypothetical protein
VSTEAQISRTCFHPSSCGILPWHWGGQCSLMVKNEKERKVVVGCVNAKLMPVYTCSHLFSSQFPLLPSLPLAPSEALSAIVLSATVLARDKYGRQLLRYAASVSLSSSGLD